MAEEDNVQPIATVLPASEEPEKPTPEGAARALSGKLGADVYLYNGPISEDMYGSVVQQITHKKHKDSLLVLVTLGGDANAAYRIARLFQRVSGKFSVFIPSYCKSAGTLLVLGANELILSVFAELGPLDVQLPKLDELGERRSGLTNQSSLQSLAEESLELFSHLMMGMKRRSRGRIRFRTAADLAAEMTTSLLAPIYGQVDPMSMGEDYRDLHIAFEYGERLAGYSGNVEPGALYKLIHEYPSHDFVIDIEEAEGLFKEVIKPSQDLYNLMELLGDHALQPLPAEHGFVKILSKSEEPKEKQHVTANDGVSDDDQAQHPDPEAKVVRI